MTMPLGRALDAVLDGSDAAALRRATARLVEVYRSGAPPSTLALADPVTAAAYAAYRMPATHAAVSRVLREAGRLGALEGVRRHVDVGGGTGAAAWAVADEVPDVEAVTVVDLSSEALALGQRIARHGPPALAVATWTRADLGGGSPLPTADLATVSYVLGELSEPLRDSVIDASASAAERVVVVGPGTPRGFASVLRARQRLLAAGWRIVAPCPHESACPVAARGDDWCHTAARLDRSALHRRVKDATVGHEDEPYTYVVAVAPTVEGIRRTDARVLRRPRQRKGMVTLELCRADGSAGPEVVTKRDRERYRSARDLAWGDGWEPADHASGPVLGRP